MSIVIVNTLEKEAELARLVEVEKKAKAKHAYKNSVRFSIGHGLQSLALFMDNHEQTCHGAMGPFTIERVAELLVECWHNPTSFNVSELAQVARKLIH